MFLKLCILGFFIFISLSFIYTNYQSQITTKIERIIFSMIFAFMNHYFFTYFFKIFYISEEAEEMNHFWIELFKIIICSEYHYYIITILIGMNAYVYDINQDHNFVRELLCLQIIYFFITITPTGFYYFTISEIMLALLIINHYDWEVNTLLDIPIYSCIGWLIYYFDFDFVSVILFIAENLLIRFILLIISLVFWYIFIVIYAVSLDSFEKIQIKRYLQSCSTVISTNNTSLLSLLLILAHILLVFIYLFTIKYVNGQIPDFLWPIIILLFTIPIAYILSLHHYPDKYDAVSLNLIPIFFEGIALNYLFFQ